MIEITKKPSGHCAYPWQQMNIDLTGEVVPCCFWSGYGNSGKPLGNTNEKSIDEIWNGPEYQALRRANATGNLEGHPCKECLAYQWSGGQYPHFTSPSPWRSENGHCWIAKISNVFLDTQGVDPEKVQMLEDGQPLPLPNAAHDDIRQLGEGRYSVWGPNLYFSTSDNSDADENGRTYELACGEARMPLQRMVVDSSSGKNIKQAKREYELGKEVMSAKPAMISLISTADCNIDCPGCSQNQVRLVRVQHRPETIPDVLAHVPYLYQFIWHGGEPYLIKRFRQFIDEYKTEDNPNLTFGFTSNGTMLNRKELGKLHKFPAINASVSIDSFNKETFGKIRKGGNYDLILRNTLGAIKEYDQTNFIFSSGMIICKSNFLELTSNLKFALENDIGLNLSPVVIYPVTEQLDIFEDFESQTKGWAREIERAKRFVSEAKRNSPKAHERVDPTGMVDAISDIYNQAELSYNDCIEVSTVVRDCYSALEKMRQPGLIVYPSEESEFDLEPISYLLLDHGRLTYSLRIPKKYSAAQLKWYLCHDILEPGGHVCSAKFSAVREVREVLNDFHKNGHSIKSKLPEQAISIVAKNYDQLILLEDGMPLKGFGASSEDVKEIGNGHHYYYDDTVVFSTSDNTDPNNNGRIYEIVSNNVYVALPPFNKVRRPTKNIEYVTYGDSSPEGLNVSDPTDISEAYLELVQKDKSEGMGTQKLPLIDRVKNRLSS